MDYADMSCTIDTTMTITEKIGMEPNVCSKHNRLSEKLTQ